MFHSRLLKKLSLTPLDEIPEVRISMVEDEVAKSMDASTDWQRRHSYHGLTRHESQVDRLALPKDGNKLQKVRWNTGSVLRILQKKMKPQ